VAETVPLAEFAGLIPAAALRELPSSPLRASVLRGGRGVNLCLRIDDEQGPRCVLRVRRGPQLAGADFLREFAAQKLAAEVHLAPAILAADAREGWMLMDFVDASPWTTERLRDNTSLWRLGSRLRRLHTLRLPGFAPIDGLALLRSHCAVVASRDVVESNRLLQQGAELVHGLELLPCRPPVLCHGDPDVENFLGHAPVLLDFEYAQVADATYDAALLLAYYPFLEVQRDAVLAAMGLDDALSLRRLPLQLELCRVINSAWERAQAVLTVLD
jgi:hypothetical protein